MQEALVTFGERAMKDVEGAKSALGAVQMVYEGTPATDDRLRRVTVSAIANHLDTLLSDNATFEEVVKAVPCIASDLLKNIRSSTYFLREAGEGRKGVIIVAFCPKCKSKLRYDRPENFQPGTFQGIMGKWTYSNKNGCSCRPSMDDLELRLATR